MRHGVGILLSVGILLVLGIGVAFIWSSTTNTSLLPHTQRAATELPDAISTSDTDVPTTPAVGNEEVTRGAARRGSGGAGGGGGSGSTNTQATGSASPSSEIPEPSAEPNYCTPQSREAECDETQHIVCGWKSGPETLCGRGPCVNSFVNECKACADAQIIYWTEGDCPLHD